MINLSKDNENNGCNFCIHIIEIVNIVLVIILIIVCFYMNHNINKIMRNKEVILNDSVSASIDNLKDPYYNTDMYIGYLIDTPLADNESKTYRSALNDYYGNDAKWTFYDNSTSKKIDVAAKFEAKDSDGFMRVIFKYTHELNKKESVRQISPSLNNDSYEGNKKLKSLIG